MPGILDQSPVLAGARPRDAVLATIELAREAERLGYQRYWLAERRRSRACTAATSAPRCDCSNRVLLCVAALAAATPEEAEALAGTIDLPVPSREEAPAYPYTPHEREEVACNRQRLVLGAPGAVRERIESLARAHEAEEAMVLTITPDYASRLRSYALLAEAFALAPALSEV